MQTVASCHDQRLTIVQGLSRLRRAVTVLSLMRSRRVVHERDGGRQRAGRQSDCMGQRARACDPGQTADMLAGRLLKGLAMFAHARALKAIEGNHTLTMTAYYPQDSSFLSKRAIVFVAIIALHVLIIWAFATGLAHRAVSAICRRSCRPTSFKTEKPKDLPPPPPPVDLEGTAAGAGDRHRTSTSRSRWKRRHRRSPT